MIRVTVTLDTWGAGTQLTELAGVTIINDGAGTAFRGNYNVKATGRDGRDLPTRHGTIEKWPRRSRPVLSLLKQALEEMGY